MPQSLVAGARRKSQGAGQPPWATCRHTGKDGGEAKGRAAAGARPDISICCGKGCRSDSTHSTCRNGFNMIKLCLCLGSGHAHEPRKRLTLKVSMQGQKFRQWLGGDFFRHLERLHVQYRTLEEPSGFKSFGGDTWCAGASGSDVRSRAAHLPLKQIARKEAKGKQGHHHYCAEFITVHVSHPRALIACEARRE